jgi:DNA-binding transcriptional ArsR family regulator
MEKFVTIAMALSDTNRVRTLVALQKGELCVCRIIGLLGLAPSTVSKHMAVLKHAGLVDSRKEERWIYYRLPDKTSRNEMVKGALAWIFRSLAGDDIITGDAARLSEILRQSPETLCRNRTEKSRNRNGRKATGR